MTYLTIAEPIGSDSLPIPSVLGDMTVPSTKGAKPTKNLGERSRDNAMNAVFSLSTTDITLDDQFSQLKVRPQTWYANRVPNHHRACRHDSRSVRPHVA